MSQLRRRILFAVLLFTAFLLAFGCSQAPSDLSTTNAATTYAVYKTTAFVTAPPTPTTFPTLTMVATPTATSFAVHSTSIIRRMTETAMLSSPYPTAAPSPTAALARATGPIRPVCPPCLASLAFKIATTSELVCPICRRPQSTYKVSKMAHSSVDDVLSLILALILHLKPWRAFTRSKLNDAVELVWLTVSLAVWQREWLLANLAEWLRIEASAARMRLSVRVTKFIDHVKKQLKNMAGQVWLGVSLAVWQRKRLLANLAEWLKASAARKSLSVQVSKFIEHVEKQLSSQPVFFEKASFLISEVGVLTVHDFSHPFAVLELPWPRCCEESVETLLGENGLVVINQPDHLPTWLPYVVQEILKWHIDEAAAQHVLHVPPPLRVPRTRRVVSGPQKPKDDVAGLRVVSSTGIKIPERPLLPKRVRTRGHGVIKFNIEERHILQEQERANQPVSQFQEIMNLQPTVQRTLTGIQGISGQMFPIYAPVKADPDNELAAPVSAEDVNALKCKDVLGWESLREVQESINGFMMDAIAMKHSFSAEIRHFLTGLVDAYDRTVYIYALRRHWGAFPSIPRGRVLDSVLVNLKALIDEYEPWIPMSEFAEMIINAARYAKSDTTRESIAESLKQQAPRLDRLKYRLEGHSKTDRLARAFGNEPSHDICQGLCDIHSTVHEQVNRAVQTVFEAVALNYLMNILNQVNSSLRSTNTQN